uniref:Guanylate cyclase n=1 Tax=Heterorhabditis bacteriophora TaxID=37862 RepID=A0A1I7XIQ3_HETBA
MTPMPPVRPSGAKKTINVGIQMILEYDEVYGTKNYMKFIRYTSYVGYKQSAGALFVALDKVREMRLLDEYDFNFIFRYDNCVEKEAVGIAIEMITQENVDVIIGPTCTAPAIAVGVIASYYNLPQYIWGFTSANELANVPRFPTVIILTPNYFTLSLALLSVFSHFKWTEFAFIYSATEDPQRCPVFLTDIQKAVYDYPQFQLSFTAAIRNMTDDNIKLVLKEASGKARIIAVCLSAPENKRQFMLLASEMNMITDEYVYIFSDLGSRGYHQASSTIFEQFGEEVQQKMMQSPLNCGQECDPAYGWQVGQLSPQLYEAFIIYATVLNRTISNNMSYRNGKYMFNITAGTYQGLLGNATIAYDGARIPEFSFSTVNTNMETIRLGTIVMDTRGVNACIIEKFTPNYSLNDENNIVWDGLPAPLSTPVCGFQGCPPPFVQLYGFYIIIAAAVVLILIVIIITVVVYAVKARIKERERLDALWKIPFFELRKVVHKHASFTSEISEANSRNVENRSETDRMCFFYYGKESLMGFKHSVMIKYEQNVNEEFRKEVITKGSLPMDSVFIQSMMMDIASGLVYIHDSFLVRHGRLTSQVISDCINYGLTYSQRVDKSWGCQFIGRFQICVVDDRWQVKISFFGTSPIKEVEHRSNEELLWTAPEIIRGDADSMGTPEGDVYSFAIIASELITKKTAWNMDNRKETVEDIIRLVSKTSINPFRPDVEPDEHMEIGPQYIHLVRECWSETPKHRHTMKHVKSLLSSAQKGKKRNLMDHVMNTLENYASSLEAEVEERMKELVEEKKKSDILLYRMLPKQVADRLKLGQAVQPESYDSVTIFFSDVVSFTTLASKCTPMQVVETIGDGYLCVSGLPNRNGLEHIKEICDLSLELITGLRAFSVPNLPREKINIRVGIHTGSVVAGVVGLTMPRYCLFGDTVNTASRMESNGKPAHIHLSMDANDLLNRTHPGYKTESRGEVIIKGKGVMNTFWLVGRGDIDIQEKPQTDGISVI